VAELVVQRLEVVDVGQDDRQRQVVAAGALELLLDPLVVAAAVVQAGQAVAGRAVGQKLDQVVRALA
jgi:hypothetical protein